MTILLISYYYGLTASGVISKRVAEQLALKGHKVIVVSNKVDNPISQDSNLIVKAVPYLVNYYSFFTRLCEWSRRQSFVYCYNILWVWRAFYECIKLIGRYHPDCIYCRSSPEEACYVGEKLRKRFGLPVLQHFSDPVPPPFEYLPESTRRKGLKQKISKIIKNATILSYGNECMLNFVEKEIGGDFHTKAFVSPDMSSGDEIRFLPQVSFKKTIVIYFGNIYGGRNPQPLFDAIDQLNHEGNDIELCVYSNLDVEVLKRYKFVRSMGFNNDTFKVLADADVLIDLDGDDEEPVFISSKLKDYLLINRPILSITPENSPSAVILSSMTTVDVVRNDVKDIKNALISILNKKIEDSDYQERGDLVRFFGPTHVTNVIVEHIAAIQSGDFE